MGADEAGTRERLKACEAALIEPAVEGHGGRIVKRMGDGYLVEFPSVVDAVMYPHGTVFARSARPRRREIPEGSP